MFLPFGSKLSFGLGHQSEEIKIWKICIGVLPTNTNCLGKKINFFIYLYIGKGVVLVRQVLIPKVVQFKIFYFKEF